MSWCNEMVLRQNLFHWTMNQSAEITDTAWDRISFFSVSSLSQNLSAVQFWP